MPSEIEDEARLLFDIRFALREVPVVRSRSDRQSDQWRDYVAAKIVAQLKLGNWIIRKGEPLKP